MDYIIRKPHLAAVYIVSREGGKHKESAGELSGDGCILENGFGGGGLIRLFSHRKAKGDMF